MNRARMAVLGPVFLLIFLLAGVVWAGSSAHYAVDWQVMSGGGAPAASGSGDVTLNGSVGQTAIGPSSGGDYNLAAGYWYGAEKEEEGAVYLPLILRSY
jgi:hypothetical protein